MPSSNQTDIDMELHTEKVSLIPKSSKTDVTSTSTFIDTTRVVSSSSSTWKNMTTVSLLLLFSSGLLLMAYQSSNTLSFSSASSTSSSTSSPPPPSLSSASLVSDVAAATTATADKDLSSVNSCDDLEICGGDRCNDDYAEFNCDGSGPACTPYNFKPRGDPNPTCTYMDDSRYNMQAFQYNGDKFSYQVWCVKDNGSCIGDKVWVTHLCDGAGVQGGDCGGDNGYFEEITINPEAGVDTTCDGEKVTYCPTFNHPGKSKTYGKYKAGWWRGFKESKYASFSFSDNSFLTGTMGGGGDYSASMITLAKRDGWYYTHPYDNLYNPDAYFIGNLYMWKCVKGYEKGNLPFTGDPNKKCYADNEPATGRHTDKKYQDIPFYSTYTLCAVYNSYTDDMQMRCDFFSYDRNGNLVDYSDGVLMFLADGDYDM